MRLWHLILMLLNFQGPLFAAEDQSIYRYPISTDSTSRLIYSVHLMGALQKMYSTDFKKADAAFQWNFVWNQDYVGAGSNYVPEKKEFSILLLGGQIRATSSNFEVLAATLCHEMGHFLGGAPRQMFFQGVDDWSSSEGQSDWFAAKNCLPKVYDQFSVSNPEFLTFHKLETTKALCRESKDQKKCQWILGTAASLALFFDEIYEHTKNRPSLLKQDPEIVQETLHTRYPSIQCRLDTMKEAAFCMDRSCERPACWFKK